eukprot:1158402-Pelagomonas_calceolata.AAC.24
MQQCTQQCMQQCSQQCTQQCCADDAFMLACVPRHALVLSRASCLATLGVRTEASSQGWLRQFFCVACDASLTCRA